MKMVRGRRNIGDVVLIKLPNNTYCYGRVLMDALFEFYDLNTNEPILTLEEIVKNPVLFKIAVMKYAVTSRWWQILGNLELDVELNIQTLFFKQDIFTKKISIYFLDGSERDSNYEACKDLECAAVWDPEHVESRLVDHFAGRPNVWVEQLRAKP